MKAIFCIGVSKMPFLYEMLSKMPFFVYGGGLENTILLYRVSNMLFCCIEGVSKMPFFVKGRLFFYQVLAIFD